MVVIEGGTIKGGYAYGMGVGVYINCIESNVNSISGSLVIIWNRDACGW